MIAYQATDVTRTDTAGLTVGANATNQVVSKPWFFVSDRGSINCAVKIRITSSTVAAGITAKLQTTTDQAGTWVDNKTVTITQQASPTDFYISLLNARAGDQQYLPLLPMARVVVSSGAGDSVVIALVEFVQGV